MKNMALIIAFFVVFNFSSAFAWDGRESETGANVEIGRGELVRRGRTIDVYNHETGQYHEMDVERIRRYGNTVEIEVYDHTTGENKTLEMDD